MRRARKALDRTVLSLVNAMTYFGEGSARSTMGNAPRDTVYERGKLRLHRLRAPEPVDYELGHGVHRAEPLRFRTPLLVIPPLMVRPYVYDLRPEHSMLRTLRNAGFDVFVVDFGVPDRSDERVRLDDYVLDYVPACVEQALAASGEKSIALVGYCMGGIFGLLYQGTFADERVAALVTIGSPVDFDSLGVVTVAARMSAPGMDRLINLVGNIPGSLSSFGFKLMSGPRTLTKYADLVVNLYNEDYVRRFDSINTWVNDMIPYPREAFRQMFKEVVTANKLLTNEMRFGDRRCDLKQVRCPLLAFAGTQDNLATPASTRQILDVVGSQDKTFLSVPGGHVGVVAGTQAPEHVWNPMVAWLGGKLS
ncbi:MAG: alpha/beta fold hydrolase [Deltaproteobacteria bacterium]|nr:alpha/beta fold hydrolase [Deltaproteobacteria bacterium]